MRKIFNRKTALLLIFLLGSFLRFYKLGEVPAGFHTDEAYLGYNAYSIFKTGREMTGNFLPLNLCSFLYSPAGYSYFSIPFIYLFGLNAFSVRFASALFSSLTILLTFLLVGQIFKNFKNKDYLALITSFLIAISPWNINLARTATENTLVVFFVTLGTILYLYWIEKQKYYLIILSLLSFAITLFIYQAARSFIPLFLPLLFIIFTKKIISKKNLAIFIGYLLLIIFPVIIIFLAPKLAYRIRTLSITQNPQTQLVLDEQLREDGILGLAPLQSRIFNNKIVSYAGTFFQNYFEHFSYNFLFTDSGFPYRYKIPSMGLLYVFEFPLIILGVWEIFKKNKRIGVFIVGWILLVPVGSALTFDDIPNLQRTLIIFPAFSILSAVGFLGLVDYLKRNIKTKYVLKFIYILTGAIIIYSFFYYLQAYYVHQVVNRLSWYRQEGYQKLVVQIDRYSKNYNKVVVTSWEGNPTIFLIFYNKYDPSMIQKIIEKTNTVDYGNLSFGKYNITNEKCPIREELTLNKQTGTSYYILTGRKGVLYVNDGLCKMPQAGVTLIADVKRLDNASVFKLVALK